VSLVADRAQGTATAWHVCPAKRLHVARELTVKTRTTPLPLHSIALAFSLPLARQAHRHCIAVSSPTLNSVTTAPISDWLSQTLRHHLLHGLHLLAEPARSKEKHKRPFPPPPCLELRSPCGPPWLKQSRASLCSAGVVSCPLSRVEAVGPVILVATVPGSPERVTALGAPPWIPRH
jgi:hypothetical protein